MFIGHFALGLAAKRAAPAVSLGTLFLACQLADLLWPNLVLLGVERLAIVPGITVVTPLDFQFYPYSHSLVALAGWAALAAIAYRAIRGSSRAMALAGDRRPGPQPLGPRRHLPSAGRARGARRGHEARIGAVGLEAGHDRGWRR